MLSTILPIIALSSFSLASARSVPNRMDARGQYAAATSTVAAWKAESTYAPGNGYKAADSYDSSYDTTTTAAAAWETTAAAADGYSYETTTANWKADAAVTTEAAAAWETTSTGEYSYATTTAAWDAAATTTAESAYETAAATTEYVAPAAYTTAAAAAVTYGSGSNNWDGFNNCVQSCQAQFGGVYSAGQAAPTASPTATAASGTKTHTVIVAPTQGVLKFVPFAVDAAVGDEIVYKWGANVHTVTKGSGGSLCNASKDNGFTSGRQNITFEFKKTINDTKPLWVFCGVPTHCQKGMFAGVNIKKVTPSDQNSTGAFDAAVVTLAGSDANVAAMWNQSKTYVGNNSIAWAWGKDLDTTGLEAWAVAPFMQNVLETRMTIAANPASSVDGFNLDTMVSPPQLVLAASSSDAPATVSASVAASTATVAAGQIAEASSTASAQGLNSGASSLARPAGLLFLLAVPVLALIL